MRNENTIVNIQLGVAVVFVLFIIGGAFCLSQIANQPERIVFMHAPEQSQLLAQGKVQSAFGLSAAAAGDPVLATNAPATLLRLCGAIFLLLPGALIVWHLTSSAWSKQIHMVEQNLHAGNTSPLQGEQTMAGEQINCAVRKNDQQHPTAALQCLLQQSGATLLVGEQYSYIV